MAEQWQGCDVQWQGRIGKEALGVGITENVEISNGFEKERSVEAMKGMTWHRL